jgi:amidohydrolase
MTTFEHCQRLAETVIRIRRDVHKHPELGYRETRTAAIAAQFLRDCGYQVQHPVARTGVVADLQRGGGPCVALRADMDALPIQETTDLSFASTNPGVMHACGHDAHTAMALGAAKVLSELLENGHVRVIIQPSEEHNYDDPEGYSGGKRMCVEGALEGVDAVLALHVHPWLPVGTIDLKAGPVLAAADMFDIDVYGESSHAGAAPHAGIDAVLAASSVVQHLHTIVSRHIAPEQTAVLSIGRIAGGTAPNIIADRVTLSGTMRSLDDHVHATLRKRIESVIHAACQVHGAHGQLRIQHHTPVVNNDARLCEMARTVAQSGFDRLYCDPPMMGGEDFGFIAQKVPSLFAFLGSAIAHDPSQSLPFLHHPQMQIDEQCLVYGMNFYVSCVLEWLKQGRHFESL